MAITSDSTAGTAGQVSDDSSDNSSEQYASDLPQWEISDLESLSQEGKLYGIDPHVIGAITQAEEHGQGGYINSENYGGFFGLSDVASYPGGAPSAALLQSTSSQSFEEQAQIVASQIALNLKSTSGDIYQAIAKSWGQDYLVAKDLGVPESTSGIAYPVNVGYGPGIVTGGSPSTPATYSSDPEGIKEAGTMGQILIQLDYILNPSHTIKQPGLVESILTVGTADVATDVATVVATVIFRAFFVLGFLALLWIGLQDLTGKRAGQVTGAATAPYRAVRGGVRGTTRLFGTPIQRKRETRLEQATELGGQRLEESVAARGQRLEQQQFGSRTTSGRQNRRLRASARAQYLRTFGEYPEDAGYKWNAQRVRFE